VRRHHHSHLSYAGSWGADRFPAPIHVALYRDHRRVGADFPQRDLDPPQYAGVAWQELQSQQLRKDTMSGNFVRNALSAAAVALSVGVAAPALAQADQPLKVGFVYVSPIGEAGWSWQQEVGRREMVEALGDKVATQYVEDVPEGADAERVIRDLAQQGNKLIFTTSFGYMNPTLKVAKQFPDVTFVHSTGYKTADNVSVTNARFYEARYLAGIVAGKMTQSNIIGYVGAFPIPE